MALYYNDYATTVHHINNSVTVFCTRDTIIQSDVRWSQETYYLPMLCSLSESSSWPLAGGMLVRSPQTALASCQDAEAPRASTFCIASWGSWLDCDKVACGVELPKSIISATDAEEKCLLGCSAAAAAEALTVNSLSSSDSRSRSSSLLSLHLSRRPRPKNASYIMHAYTTVYKLFTNILLITEIITLHI